MKNLPPSPLRALARGPSAGFTLIEVTLAIGILAFAVVSVFSLLPISLTQAREAMDRTHATRIQQMLVTQVQQTPYAEVDTQVLGQVHYFDGEGQLLTSGTTGFVYSARVIAAPGNAANHTALGLTAQRARTLAVRIAMNRVASSGPVPVFGERQIAFVISDVAL